MDSSAETTRFTEEVLSDEAIIAFMDDNFHALGII
jgi:hypothetical protein